MVLWQMFYIHEIHMPHAVSLAVLTNPPRDYEGDTCLNMLDTLKSYVTIARRGRK